MTSNPEHTKCFEQLKEWIKRQPHLPDDLDDNLILRFAHSCYYDLEKAKTTVEMFFSVRATCTDLITNRDPLSSHMKKILNIINIAQVSMRDNRCLWLYQINDPGLDNYDYVSDAKLFFLSTDCRFLVANDLPEEDIVIIDAKDINLKFLTKLNLSAARRLSKYQENALPIRLKQVHVVNAPSIIDKIYAVLKPFITKQITELIHFHPPNSETLYRFVSKEELPADFGGPRPPMAELTKDINLLISQNREKLLDENLWRIPEKSKNGASTAIGSFRTLAID